MKQNIPVRLQIFTQWLPEFVRLANIKPLDLARESGIHDQEMRAILRRERFVNAHSELLIISALARIIEGRSKVVRKDHYEILRTIELESGSGISPKKNCSQIVPSPSMKIQQNLTKPLQSKVII